MPLLERWLQTGPTSRPQPGGPAPEELRAALCGWRYKGRREPGGSRTAAGAPASCSPAPPPPPCSSLASCFCSGRLPAWPATAPSSGGAPTPTGPHAATRPRSCLWASPRRICWLEPPSGSRLCPWPWCPAWRRGAAGGGTTAPPLGPSARCCVLRTCWKPASTSVPSPPGDTAWTRTRAATRRSWPSPSACAGAASAPGRAARRRRSTRCRCCRACWCCAASPARGRPRGCPRPGPSPSTRSSSACPSAAPVSCPGRLGEPRPRPASPAPPPPRAGQSGGSPGRAPLFMGIYCLFICPTVSPGRYRGSGPRG